RLNEFDREAPSQISHEKYAKQTAVDVRDLCAERQETGEHNEEHDVIKLRRMPADSVAEIDRRGNVGRIAVGVVLEAGEKTTDAADGHSEDEGKDKGVTGRMADALNFFGDFDADPSAQQTTDDGLP